MMHVEWSSGAHLKASPPSPSECWPRAQSQKFFGQFVGQTNSSPAAVELVEFESWRRRRRAGDDREGNTGARGGARSRGRRTEVNDDDEEEEALAATHRPPAEEVASASHVRP